MQISMLIPHVLWRYNRKTMTLAVYIHHFTTAAKQCTFDNDTVAVCIFAKGLQDAPIIAAKIYEKDPKFCLKLSS